MMEDLSDLALEAAERYTLTGEPLSKIIANIALREALTTEQIKRVVENANRAVFAKLFSNGVHEFDIAKLEDVLSVLHDNGGVESNDNISENEEAEYDLDGLEESNMDDGALNLFRELFGVSEEESAKLNEKPKDDSTIVIKFTKIKQAAEDLKGANQEFELDYNTLVEQIGQALKYLTPSKLQIELLKRVPKGISRTEYEQIVRQAISDAQQLIQQDPDSYVHTKVSAFGSNRKNNQSPFTQRDFEEYVPIAKPTDRNYNDYLDSLKAVTSSCRDDKSLYALREDLTSNIPETIPEQDRDTYKKLIHQMIMEARSLNKMRSALLEAKKPGEQNVLDLDDPDNLILINQLADALTSPNFNEEQLRKKVVDPSQPDSDVNALVLEEALNKAKYLVNKYPDTFRKQPKQASLRDILTQTKLSADANTKFERPFKLDELPPFGFGRLKAKKREEQQLRRMSMPSELAEKMFPITHPDYEYTDEFRDLLIDFWSDKELDDFRNDVVSDVYKDTTSKEETDKFVEKFDKDIGKAKQFLKAREALSKVPKPEGSALLEPALPDDLVLINEVSKALAEHGGDETKVKQMVLDPRDPDYDYQNAMFDEAIYYAKHLNNKSPKTFKNQNIQTPKQAADVNSIANIIYTQGDKSIMKVASLIWQNDVSPQDIIDAMHATYRTSAFDKYIVKAAQYAIELSKNAGVPDDVIDKIASTVVDTIASLNEFKKKAEQLNNLKSEGQETPKLEKQIMQVAERVVKLLKPQSAIRKMETF